MLCISAKLTVCCLFNEVWVTPTGVVLPHSSLILRTRSSPIKETILLRGKRWHVRVYAEAHSFRSILYLFVFCFRYDCVFPYVHRFTLWWQLRTRAVQRIGLFWTKRQKIDVFSWWEISRCMCVRKYQIWFKKINNTVDEKSSYLEVCIPATRPDFLQRGIQFLN